MKVLVGTQRLQCCYRHIPYKDSIAALALTALLHKWLPNYGANSSSFRLCTGTLDLYDSELLHRSSVGERKV